MSETISNERMGMASDERLARLMMLSEQGVMRGYVGPGETEFDFHLLRQDIAYALREIEANRAAISWCDRIVRDAQPND